MRGLVLATLAMAVAVTAGGCAETRNKLLGRDRTGPDEFAVYSRAPLSLPPDYQLRPPAPGSDRPQGIDPKLDAQAALVGRRVAERAQGAASSGTGQPGMDAFLRRLGADKTDPDIRTVVNSETTILTQDDKSLTDRIMFWGKPTEYGTVVDPTMEAKRIQSNQALGKPVTDGESPVIQRKRRALLEGIFN